MPHPPISYPKAFDPPSSIRMSSSSPQRPTHTKNKSSLSGTMSWLTRSSTSPTPYAPANKATRISESKFADILPSRPGVTVVRTPQEALIRSPYIHQGDADVFARSPTPGSSRDSSSLPSPPASKSSPNLPLQRDLAPASPKPRQILVTSPSFTSSAVNMSSSGPLTPVSAPAIPIIAPVIVPTPPTKKSRPAIRPPTDIPPVPEHAPVPPLNPQPLLSPLLLSPLPTTPIDPHRALITLETCTQSFKTTLDTLISHPSRLAEYFAALLESALAKSQSVPEDCSIHSRASGIDDRLSPFNSVFQTHVEASGVLSNAAPAIMHIFLDRPSEPYPHILAFLRAPTSLDHPPSLPRGVQLSAGATESRVEMLLQLRDEAHYLGLENLVELCTEELSHRHKVRRRPSKRSRSRDPDPATLTALPRQGHSRAQSAPSVPQLPAHSTTSTNAPHALSGIEEREGETETENEGEEDPEDSLHLLRKFPTPNSSAPSSRSGSAHESIAGVVTFPIVHKPALAKLDFSGSASASSFSSVKARPAGEWI